MNIRVIWEGLDRETLAYPGVRLSYLLIKEGIDFPLPCGGEGVCGRCRVRFLENPPVPSEAEKRLLSPEDIQEGVRLACCAVVTQDTRVELLYGAYVMPQETLIPLKRLTFSGSPPRSGSKALALDLGTTTLVLSRLDLSGGEREEVLALPNPQSSWGGDVVSRMKAAMEGKRENMIRALWRSILPQTQGASYMVVSGNSVMETLLAGYPLDSLARYPFRAPFTGGEWREEPLPYYLMPLVGRFLGGDIASLILVLDLMGAGEKGVALDLGTNAEVVVWSHRGMWAASAPAGPAFEGMGVSSGVGLSLGAVVRVEREKGELYFKTIDGESPKGFCGSGLVSLMALLLGEGVIDPSGRMEERGELPFFWRVRRDDEGLTLGPGLSFTQEDVRKLQLAKGAVTSALMVLLPLAGLEKEGFPLYLAGAFGTSLEPRDLVTLGLIPQGVGEVVRLGNASLVGAEAGALSEECLRRGGELVSRVEVVDLVNQDNYQEVYLDSLSFKPW